MQDQLSQQTKLETWQFLDTETAPWSGSPDLARLAVRLNCFGSLYYFLKVALGRRRLTDTLHFPICLSLEREHIKDVYELPRDHFKSTICSEGLPMWRALPLRQSDIDALAKLGYSDEFIEYQIRVHDPDKRHLVVSENITNAAKLGTKIRRHFESGAMYRTLFPETLPTPKETWTNYSLHVKPTGQNPPHGEGTFDFLGVGSALQSRHYNGLVIQDDLVGRKAIESASIMDKTIEYHQLVAGAFEQPDKEHENDELVVGNRWSYADLNSYIRENEPWFRFSTHSALGGCCAVHSADTPIFHEEFSKAKLSRLRKRLGGYTFSCQFLNNPASPEDAAFKESWLSYFRLSYDTNRRPVIIHEPRPEQVSFVEGLGPGAAHILDEATRNAFGFRKNLLCNNLRIGMATDPAHAGNAGTKGGRARHAIVVVGISPSDDNYLLDTWAKACTYDEYVAQIYTTCSQWGLREFGLETIAAQRYLKYHLEYRNRIEGRRLSIKELKGEVEAPDGGLTRNKTMRIQSIIEPIAQNGRLWVQRRHQDFITEFITFPRGRFVDQLDSFAYIPQVVQAPWNRDQETAWATANAQRAAALRQPYSLHVN